MKGLVQWGGEDDSGYRSFRGNSRLGGQAKKEKKRTSGPNERVTGGPKWEYDERAMGR